RIAFLTHGLPDFRIGFAPAIARCRAMKNVAVDVIGAEMLERAGHRLHHLLCQWRAGIVRKAVVLARNIGELRLKEKIVASDGAIAINRSEGFTDPGFVIVATLVGGVDGTKAGADCPCGQSCGAVFFPCGAVEKIWNGGG